MTEPNLRDLWQAFVEADKAWSDELRKQFGKQAGDIRYKPEGEGQPGSLLRATYDKFAQTGKAWRAAIAKGKKMKHQQPPTKEVES